MRSPTRVPLLSLVAAAFPINAALADGPKDNLPDQVRPIPPPGIAIPDAERVALQQGAQALGEQIAALKKS